MNNFHRKNIISCDRWMFEFILFSSLNTQFIESISKHNKVDLCLCETENEAYDLTGSVNSR